MTLGDGKRKVLMLLDEYSSGGVITVDEDLEKKMADFFDMSQKSMAGVKKIIQRVTVTFRAPQPGEGDLVVYEMPENFQKPFRVWRNGRVTKKYPWSGRAMLAPAGETGQAMVEYFAIPKTITQATEDTYELEVSEDAATLLPYWVAAQQLVVDLVVDYGALLNLYDRGLNLLDLSTPESGGGGIRQSFYR